jgi:hypothetical protein
MNPFVGSWIGPDEYTSEVQYTVSLIHGEVAVSAIDPSDGETADVSDISSNPDTLEFKTRWPSTGRECLCVFRLLADDQVELTFTYTDKALLVRKRA